MWNRIIEYSQKELPALIHAWGPKILMAAGLIFAFWPASRIARAVPPVLRISTPASASVCANGTKPSLSDTEMRAR